MSKANVETLEKILEENHWNRREDLFNPDYPTLHSNGILWMPRYDPNGDFFNEHGLIIRSYGYNRVQWVRISKKIFKNKNVYKDWKDNLDKEKAVLDKGIRDASRVLSKKKRKRKHSSAAEAKRTIEELTAKRKKMLSGHPDIRLFKDKLYYMCYAVSLDEIMNTAQNNNLIDTIIFNMDQINAS